MMSKKVNHPDAARVMEAFKAKTARERNEIFAQHEPAYRLTEAIGAGMIDPAGLTEQGTAAVGKFAQAVGIDHEEDAESGKRAGKKDESKQ